MVGQPQLKNILRDEWRNPAAAELEMHVGHSLSTREWRQF